MLQGIHIRRVVNACRKSVTFSLVSVPMNHSPVRIPLHVKPTMHMPIIDLTEVAMFLKFCNWSMRVKVEKKWQSTTPDKTDIKIDIENSSAASAVS